MDIRILKINKKDFNKIIDYIFVLQKRIKDINERLILLEINNYSNKNINKILEEIENDKNDGR